MKRLSLATKLIAVAVVQDCPIMADLSHTSKTLDLILCGIANANNSVPFLKMRCLGTGVQCLIEHGAQLVSTWNWIRVGNVEHATHIHQLIGNRQRESARHQRLGRRG